MMQNLIKKYNRFYFVGIGGASMSALAKILKQMGKEVCGCDRCDSEYVDELRYAGVDVEITNAGDARNCDAVVYTDAVPENNNTIIMAKRAGKVVVSRGEFLRYTSELFKRTIAISGCHGKTTCTAMIAHIFKTAGIEFGAHIGGCDLSFSNAYLSGYDYFITEACEYKRNFLRLKPDIAVILNSEADHLDCYSSVEELKIAYKSFAFGAAEVVKLYGDLDGIDGQCFGFDDRAQYYAKKMKCKNGKCSFEVYEGDCCLGVVTLNVYGKHNVLNALAALAVSRRCGINFECISAGLKSFLGVKRRFEDIGEFNGARCIADYAHHPDEIKAALKTARLIVQGDIFVVFQPHTYSRTKMLFGQFKAVLGQVKKLMIYKTFAAREYYDDAGSALTLSQSVKRSVYGDKLQDIKQFISLSKKGDVILFLGAGDIYDIAKIVIS